MVCKELYDARNELITIIPPILGPLLTGFVTVFFSCLMTTSIDHYFWQKPFPFWPELEVFIFNAVQGQSVAWGVLPWAWYFKKALPKMLLTSCPLIPFGLKDTWRVAAPAGLFVFAYS